MFGISIDNDKINHLPLSHWLCHTRRWLWSHIFIQLVDLPFGYHNLQALRSIVKIQPIRQISVLLLSFTDETKCILKDLILTKRLPAPSVSICAIHEYLPVKIFRMLKVKFASGKACIRNTSETPGWPPVTGEASQPPWRLWRHQAHARFAGGKTCSKSVCGTTLSIFCFVRGGLLRMRRTSLEDLHCKL